MKQKSEKEQYTLRSGFPCVKHKCIKCCLETRMPLSYFDVKRILNLGYSFKDFVLKTEEGQRLKNRKGRCVFLSEEGCQIYPCRPEGCQLYPLVYNENLQKAIIDYICPHGYEFKVEETDVQKLRTLLKKLEDHSHVEKL